MTTVADLLDSLTREGSLFTRVDEETVRCEACAHRCLLRPGRRGVCQVRFNRDGRLFVPWGYVAGLQSDPIEKKPFYHVYPGHDALTFGMLGCDMHCDYCQNWLTSQTLRDPAADFAVRYIREITPQQMIALAKQTGARAVISSYNEPLITTEWALDIFAAAKEAGLLTAYVSNGHATPSALRALAPFLDAYKVDLKSMQDKHYRRFGGRLQPVLDTIQMAHDLGLWVEVVTLVVPDFNDSPDDLWEAARFIRGVSEDIPWHVTAFHPDYQMTDRTRTTADILRRAADIGREAGLHYIYAGNLPGRVDEYETTFCPQCRQPLIRRTGFQVRDYQLTAEGACPRCGARVAGLWPPDPKSVRLNRPFGSLITRL